MPLTEEKPFAEVSRVPQLHSIDSSRERHGRIRHIEYLRIALVLVALIFIAGIYPLTIIWPSGWSWHTGHSDYLQMILGLYATLGVFLLVASRKPLAHLSLIWFTVWSSVVHAGIMAVQSLANSGHMGHFGVTSWRCLRLPLSLPS